MSDIVKGDTVLIRRGKEKGKHGVVKAVFPGAGKATIEGINIVKRHTKPQQAGGNMSSSQAGGIVEKENAVPLSSLQYVCEKCKTPTRLRHGRTADGKTHRICAKCGEPARDSAKGA